MKWIHALVLAGAMAIWLGGANAAPPEVRVQVVDYAELGKQVRANFRRVVVLDFWADNCVPCKQRFPHLVKMSRAYAGKGLVVISVNVDANPRNKKVQERALKFLRKVEADFTNLMLDEPWANWSKKVGVEELPAAFVFDREGHWRRFKSDAAPEEVEKQAVEWLGSK